MSCYRQEPRDGREILIWSNRSGICTDLVVQTSPSASCESCGLFGRAAKLMRVAGLPGLYCSILCAEQGIYECGCHWCGEKLDNSRGGSRFCSQSCKDKAAQSELGDGKRFVTWLEKHAPELVHQERGQATAPDVAGKGQFAHRHPCWRPCQPKIAAFGPQKERLATSALTQPFLTFGGA
jgi:hypothetical protein